MTSPADSSLIGTLVADRYRILSRLGEGGMGQVFLAEHERMKRKSAIKIMRPALVGDADAMQRFTREAENASKLSHPNVASIFDFGETSDGLVYLAMEFIEGESLQAALTRESALAPEIAADVIVQTAEALQAAHDKGILHRDLKPDNLMLSRRPDGTYLVKLVDFGIARTVDSSATKVTRTGFAIGTPDYMSPEQLSGDTLDARSDIYALALVAFITLTGREAFGDASAKDALITRLTSRPKRLADVRPDVDWPAAMQTAFDRGLAPEVADRYGRAIEFADDLAAAIALMAPSGAGAPYREAVGIRASAAARRTPSHDIPVVAAAPRARTAAAPVPVSPSRPSQPRDIPMARTLGMPEKRRGGFVLWLVVLGAVIYGVYWYGSQQRSGSARQAADAIKSAAKTIYTPVKPAVEKARRAATPK